MDENRRISKDILSLCQGVSMSINRTELESYLNALLSPNNFNDESLNGIQIEGKERLSLVAFALSASEDSLKAAISKGADALIVHHGLLWRNAVPQRIAGVFARKIIPLIKKDINLLAYHLPLDAHAEVGNNAVLASRLGLENPVPFGEYHGQLIGFSGHFQKPVKAADLKKRLEKMFGRKVISAHPETKGLIRTLGIITGGAGGQWTLALEKNLDAYLTGEINEHHWSAARENGIHLFAGGHTATETPGIIALMKQVQKDLGVKCVFIPSKNPV
jgi:dinuclear metal center YbgI/SA1388 family protein